MQIRRIFQDGNGSVTQTNWNYNLPLFSMCLFYWQRIHFKRRLLNNQVVFIAPRITVSSNFGQSACIGITWDDPVGHHWRHQVERFRNRHAMIGWLLDPRGYWLFSTDRKEILSPTRLPFPYLVTKVVLQSRRTRYKEMSSVDSNQQRSETEQSVHQWEESQS